MTKYIDADKLLAKIEQKISICEKQRSDAIEVECFNLADHASARIGELHVIQETIASLQQEQPECGCSEKPNNLLRKQPEVDLEKEINKVWDNGLSDELAGPHNNFDICAKLARYFAEWGAIHLNARKEE